jgi:ERCC4-related helicase
VSDNKQFPPVFATNRPGSADTVATEVNRLLNGVRTKYAKPAELAIATAYLNPQGFNLIADEVEQAPVVRLLLGAEPDEAFVRRAASTPIDVFDRGLKHERDMVGFTLEADHQARRLVAWLRHAAETGTPIVEVRRFTKSFLHGKAFIAVHPDMPAVLAGSSNLTYAGLMLNRELNLGYPSGQHTHLVVEWFEELWDEAEQFDLAGFYEERWLPHSPWTVFLRMLHELYGSEPDDDDFRANLVLPLTGFQRDGVRRAEQLLERLGGVLVCDEVGLGKTFIAGELIAQAAHRRRQDVLVVVPAALRASTWKPFLDRFDFSRRVEVWSYDDLRLKYEKAMSSGLDGLSEYQRELERFALIVVDEAHNLRNKSTLRHEAVDRLLQGAYAKNIVLLTATPVNNSLDDLENLVSLFVRNDGEFAHMNIPSISKYIKDAKALDPDALSPEHLFDLMDQVAVRRTRKFIKDEYAGETMMGPGGKEVTIEFPTPKLDRLDYEFSPAGESLLHAVVYALEGQKYDPKIKGDMERALRDRCADPKRLSMARYVPSLFALDNKIERRQISGSALLESALLKRFESSTVALRNTLNKMISSHETFLAALDGGVVLTGKLLGDFAVSDDEIEDFLDDVDHGDAGISELSEYDEKKLRNRVEMDVKLLQDLVKLCDEAMKDDDPKLKRLLKDLEDIVAESLKVSPDGVSERDRRKVIVFGTFTDTIKYLRERVVEEVNKAKKGSALAEFKGRIPEAVFGSRTGISQEQRARVLAEFVPFTAGPLDKDGIPLSQDKHDVLFATDVLSEGVNLQQAGQIVSVDLPWNPMRLVQRHGRIDRIGSHHRHVRIGCFFPAKHLEELLQLEEVLQRKIAYANAAIGMGEIIPGQRAKPNLDLIHNDIAVEIEAINDIAAGNAEILLSRGGIAALSGEEYRRRLTKASRSDGLRKEVLALPYGSGSGFVSSRIRQPGWVFCARIGDHPKPWFRFVAADPSTWLPTLNESGQPLVVSDTLTALVASDPGGDATEVFLPDAAASGVYAAWEIAHRDMFESWMWMTDRKNLQPEIPLALREAAGLVIEHGDVLGVEQNQLLQKLNAKWDKEIVDAVRRIVRSEKSNNEKLLELAEYVQTQGLRAPEPLKPLPVIDKDDIRVVCWMAVSNSHS